MTKHSSQVRRDGRRLVVLAIGAAVVAVLLSAAPSFADRSAAYDELLDGNTAYFNGDYASAETHYTAAIAADSTWAVAYNNRGLARLRRADFGNAATDFETAKQRDASYVAPYLNEGKCLAVQQRYTEAVNELEAGLAKSPGDARFLFNLGWVYDEMNQTAEALARYDAALEADSSYYRAYVGKGVALARSGSTADAVAAFYAAINATPSGDMVASIAAYDLGVLRGDGLAFSTDSAAADFRDGVFALSAGFVDTAISKLQSAQSVDSKIPDIPWLLSWCYLKKRDRSDAATALGQAQALMLSLDVRSWDGSSIFVNGIPRGTTPAQVTLFPGQSELTLRTPAGEGWPRERSAVVWGSGSTLLAHPVVVGLGSPMPSYADFAPLTDDDGDWLDDDWERTALSSLGATAGADPDGDKLSNLREYWTGTDPNEADTDGDGTKDGDEVAAASDPLGSGTLPPLRIARRRLQTLIAASGHTPGVGQTMWMSDAVVHNAGANDDVATLYFMKKDRDNCQMPGLTVVVPAGQSVKLADLVKDTFGEAATSGAVLIDSDETMVVTSRTFNNASSGTYGQYIEGRPLTSALTSGLEARLIQLTRNSIYRTNIGFANPVGKRLAVRADIYRSDGSLIGSRSYTVEPFGSILDTDVLGSLGASADDAYAIVKSSTADARYFAYASVTDNRTGDPVLVVPAERSGSSTEPLYIPAAAHIAGVSGTNWRTDLEIHNPTDTRAEFTVDLLKRGQDNSSYASRSFYLDAGRSVRYNDVLETVFDFPGAAALRVAPTSGSVMISSRTYNDLPSGTYGQFIPGLPAEEALVAGQTARLVQLSESPDTESGFRTNVGLFNVSDVPITVDVALAKGDGTMLATPTYALAPFEYKQVDRIFKGLTDDTLGDGFAVVGTETPNGRLVAFASVTDNRSGDPIYIPQVAANEITVTLPGGVPLVLVRIPAGTFMMGSPSSERQHQANEGPQHAVTLTQDFYIGKYELTQRQWVAVMGQNPYAICGMDCPVVNVTWNDVCGGTTGTDCTASSFIGKLNALLGKTKFRLPTEAEWEYAARAGSTGAFSFGDDSSCSMTSCESCGLFDRFMWWCGTLDSALHPVGQKSPNAWGLYDMHGNAQEWVADLYGSSYYSVSPNVDPTGPTSGGLRVARGGEFDGKAWMCRSAFRNPFGQWLKFPSLGFRIAMSR